MEQIKTLVGDNERKFWIFELYFTKLEGQKRIQAVSNWIVVNVYFENMA